MPMKKYYLVCLNASPIGDAFEEAEEHHDGDQQNALDCLADQCHVQGLMISNVRRLLTQNEDAYVLSWGPGLTVEGLSSDVLAAALKDGLLEEIEIDENDETAPETSDDLQ